ncbi:polysaccharide deacetylase family protein [Streptococcus pluranimalium]|uniref:polysaccharide deacetylase family protein n=1 Tax=Streptococcus pluranimalium TaxID=82348 RepID=UPI0039FC907A
MKKILLILFFLIGGTFLIMFLGRLFYNQYRQEKVTSFVENFQNNLSRDISISNGQEIWSDKESWIYFSIGEEGNPVQEELKVLMPKQNQLGQYANHEVKRLHLLYPQKVSSDLDGISELVLKESSYRIKGLDIIKEKDKEHQRIHFKDARYKTPFTLNDFIRDKGAFRKVIEAATSQGSWSQERKNTVLEPFQSDDWSEINFSYKDSQLFLTKELSLPLTSIFDAIQGTYLTGNDLTSYQDYQEEKKKNLKRVALTFDDGPNPDTTPRVLEILDQYDAKATFFTLGHKLAGQETLVKRMIDQGNEIGNHTWSHPNLTTLSVEGIKQEITATNQAIEKITHQKPTLMRPPYGATNATVQAAVGMKEIMWTVDTLDWQSHSTPAIMKKLKEQLTPGGIILMHDIHQTSVDALPSVLDYLKSQGYEVVTVSELYGY